MNVRRSIITLFIGCCLSTLLQAHPCTSWPADSIRPHFSAPFDFPATFAGNFGEIRANHFHGGLDFKTQGVSGKPVHALGNGYISRIRVTHGSGYVLDVAYDNGYSTINRHLSAFVGKVAERVEQLQYETESWEVEIVPEPDEYPVRTGEVIALSGNTGYSFGPHLHLDVIDSATGETVDPIPFFRSIISDHKAPRAEGLMIFPQRGRGVVDGSWKPKAFAIGNKRPITAWGWIGVGIKAYDYMDGAGNRLGVYRVNLEVDGREVFESVIDRFNPDDTRYINSWTKAGYMKSFVEPGNKLNMLHPADSCRGLILIDEERTYQLTYTLTDATGNRSTVRFRIQGKPTDIAQPEYPEKYVFRYNKVNYLQEPGLRLLVPQGAMYDDAYLDFEIRTDTASPAFTYRLSQEVIPLHTYAELSLGLRHKPTADSTKYYVASVNKDGRLSYVGGEYSEGFVHARVRQLGSFTIGVDTVPPTLTPVGIGGWGSSGQITVKVRDKHSGIASYRGEIDGRYALFGKPNAVNGNLICRLDERHVERGKRHTLVLRVTDLCGNEAVATYSFRW